MLPTTLHRLFDNARQRPDAAAYFTKRCSVGVPPASGQGTGSPWVATTWSEHVAEVRRAARAFIALGLEHGEAAGILGFNKPEWVVFDLAVMLAGGAAAGIYVTSSPEDVEYVLGHCNAQFVLVENEEQWEKVRKVRERLPKLRHIITMRGTKIDDAMTMDWDSFLAKGDAVPDSIVEERLAAIQPNDLATLIYTSGTMGPPKGVMLSHHNLAWTGTQAVKVGELSPSDTTISYLPLSHVAEQIFCIHAPTWGGYPVYFAEAVTKVADNLKEVQPTIVFGVPRVWERFYDAVRAKLAAEKGAKKKILDWAQRVGRQVSELKNRGKQPTGMLALQYALAKKLVYRKIKPQLGLANARLPFCGGAPVAKEILEFFSGLDVIIYEVYGQSEDCGPTTFNHPGRNRFGTAGPPWPGLEIKIAEDGEILVRSGGVFLGYLNDPEATAAALEDGWLHSGDVGAMNEEGFLVISGRKKEILITSGGKNISPAQIETKLKQLELVADAVVVGDNRRYITSLISLEPQAAARFAESRGLNGATLHEHPEVIAEVGRLIDEKVNPTLAKVETVRRFRILPRPLSIEDGELTPTLKVKRRVVYERFKSEIESMYVD